MKWIRESNLIENIDDYREDLRCQKAWEWLLKQTWHRDTILKTHKKIMWVLNRKIAGKTRAYLEVNVRVGNHIPYHWSEVEGQFNAWIHNAKYAHERGWNEIKRKHIDFEYIHPFADGNGRIGRMIMNWQRVKGGLEPLCILASERWDYYKWFEIKSWDDNIKNQGGR